jgi:hypothetical protein
VIAVVWAFFLVVGVPGVFVMLRTLKSARSEPGWIGIPGVVLESRTLNTAEGYLPTIRYEYNFEGHRRENSIFRSVVITSSSRGPSEQVVSRYPVGANVTYTSIPTIHLIAFWSRWIPKCLIIWASRHFFCAR